MVSKYELFPLFLSDVGAPSVSLCVSQGLERGLHMHVWECRDVGRKGGQRTGVGKAERQAFCIQ